MTAYSQNGFTANDRSVIAQYTVPGTNLRIALRKGDASVILLEFLRRYHLEVEPLPHDPQDLWGYAERTIRGSATVLSNHASGTAVDCRAQAHPLGVKNTFTPEKKSALLRLIGWFEGALRWGGSYSGRVDEMHTELDGPASLIARIANKVRGIGSAPATVVVVTPTEDDPLQGFEWPAGKSAHKLIVPVGNASQLVARAWFSMACDGVINSYDVWFQSDDGGKAEYHGTLAKDRRVWWELPSGTTQIVVHVDASGPVGAAVETKSK
jgi:hypothetical protein